MVPRLPKRRRPRKRPRKGKPPAAGRQAKGRPGAGRGAKGQQPGAGWQPKGGKLPKRAPLFKPAGREEQSFAERLHDAQEARAFRKRAPDAFRRSRTREEIAKRTMAHRRTLREAAIARAKAWLALEDILLSKGRKMPNRVRDALRKAQEATLQEARCLGEFLAMRAEITTMRLQEMDWNAFHSALAISEKMAALYKEIEFYGQARKLIGSGLLGEFAELVARLNVGRDKGYSRMKRRRADAKKGLEDAIARRRQHENAMAERKAEGKTTQLQLRDAIVGDCLVIAQQRYNLAQAQENLYRHMKSMAKKRDLKNFLFIMEREAGWLKEGFAKEKKQCEEYFRKTGRRRRE